MCICRCKLPTNSLANFGLDVLSSDKRFSVIHITHLFGNALEKPPHWPDSVEPQEGVWRDYYTGEELDDYPKPWNGNHDKVNGNDSNCIIWAPDRSWESNWFESDCLRSAIGCACEKGEPKPIFRLRGLCKNSRFRGADPELGSRWTMAQDPNFARQDQQHYVSGMNAYLKLHIEGGFFYMGIMNYNATAISWSESHTYVLGLHTWTVTSDHRTCHPGACPLDSHQVFHIFLTQMKGSQ